MIYYYFNSVSFGVVITAIESQNNFAKQLQVTLTRKVQKVASLLKDPLLKYTQELDFMQ